MGGVAAMLRGRAVKNRGVLFNCHNFAKKIFQRIKVALLLSPLWASNGMKPGLKALEILDGLERKHALTLKNCGWA